MPERGRQDPVTEGLLPTADYDSRHNCERDPLVDLVLQFAVPDLDLVAERNDQTCGAGKEVRQEVSFAEKTELLQELRTTKCENAKLRQQIKQQFHDLGEVESMMDGLEAQVDSHEVVIKQQDLRIQEQEEIILQLNTRMQQCVIALVCNAFKTRF